MPNMEMPPANEVGCDEVGRGPLCGDVVAAAVMFPTPLPDTENPLWKEIKDSKKVSKKKMGILANFICEKAAATAIGRASVEEIDQMNILQASMLAMHRALDGIHIPFDSVLVDGNRFNAYRNVPHRCLVGADATQLHVAAASILAKHTRDMELIEIVRDNPELQKYEIHKNMGYATRAHMQALREYGPTPFHRMSFAPCAAARALHNTL
jgi:ribonuclease HII